MSKYNLIDIFEGMSSDEMSKAKEADRLKDHPERDIIKKIQALMAKEKTEVKEGDAVDLAIEASQKKAGIKEDQYDDIADADDDIPADKKKEAALAYRKVDKGASYEKATSHLKEDNIEEMTGETFNRIDGLTNQNLKAQFLDKFSEIYEDMVEAGDLFDASDVIDYLCTEMQAYAVDTKMDAGGMMEEINKIKSVNLREEIGPTGIAISQNQLDNLKKLGAISGLEVTVQDKDGSNVRKVDYTLTNTDFEKGDDDYDYLEDGLKEHFGRFMKDYQ